MYKKYTKKQPQNPTNTPKTPILEKNQIKRQTKENFVDLTLNTIAKNKQVLIFNNSKNSSEATAEKIATATKLNTIPIKNQKQLTELSQKILKCLQNPTKQCKRLAKCVEKGIAFHHSGLTSKQRTLIETNFKQGLIKAISSTPTLAAGLNLPAYKVIIKDYKRFTNRGMTDIPILEFHQMAGRAGRPGKEIIGRAVLLIKNPDEHERVKNKYIFGKPEEIFSKLAVEPTLKMYLLSLISMDMINEKNEIKDFFKNTLYAKQYQDLEGLYFNVFRILQTLKSYKFIDQQDDYYRATKLGKRVSELYLNPDTANYILTHFDKFEKIFNKEIYSKQDIYKLIHFISNANEMKPLFRVQKAEEDTYIGKIEELGDDMITEYDPFEIDYGQYMQTFKITDIFEHWINEAPEDFICEKYKTTPGELTYKLSIIDWLLYCLEEFATLKKNHFFKNIIKKLRIRFKNGIKEEIIQLVSLKGIGRVRARKLYNAKLKTYKDLEQAPFEKLEQILGTSITIKIKQQLKTETIPYNKINYTKTKPTQIKIREVSHEEVDNLVQEHLNFKKQKEKIDKETEKQNNLLRFF